MHSVYILEQSSLFIYMYIFIFIETANPQWSNERSLFNDDSAREEAIRLTCGL